ncbi:hypothetical protein [Ruminococcus bromii]|nr:hypothetical protein [Ruminococcus bromii]
MRQIAIKCIGASAPQYFSERFAHAERLNRSPPFLRWGTSVLRL